MEGSMTSTMTKFIEPHNSNWKIEFEKINQVIKAQLNGLEIDIQHVGSTAISGLIAKPILDIDIIINNKNLLDDITQRLEKIGYISKGEQGIAGRFAFRQTSDDTPSTSPKQKWQPHHLYVCFADSLALKNHLLFRDALRKDIDLVEKYGQLKISLTDNLKITSEHYTTMKTEFIISVLATMEFEKEELSKIISANA